MTSNLSRYRWHSFLPLRVRSAAWSLLLSICGVVQAPLLFVLHGPRRTIAISLFLIGWDYQSPLLGRGVRALEQLYSYAVTGHIFVPRTVPMSLQAVGSFGFAQTAGLLSTLGGGGPSQGAVVVQASKLRISLALKQRSRASLYDRRSALRR